MGMKKAGQKRSDAEWLRGIILPNGISGRNHKRLNAIADRLDAIDGDDDDESSIDFVPWKRFVGLLRESANEINLALASPQLREAATRIEKVAVLAENEKRHYKRGNTAVARAVTRILRVLNGKY